VNIFLQYISNIFRKFEFNFLFMFLFFLSDNNVYFTFENSIKVLLLNPLMEKNLSLWDLYFFHFRNYFKNTLLELFLFQI